MFLCPPKSQIFRHNVDEKGLHLGPQKVEAVTKLEPPTTPRELRRFLDLVSWYRRFGKDVSITVVPLYAQLKKKAK